jgi:hypothetical protein
MGKAEYYTSPLSVIIRFYIDEGLKHKDWEVVAIDVAKDNVVLKRYELD